MPYEDPLDAIEARHRRATTPSVDPLDALDAQYGFKPKPKPYHAPGLAGVAQSVTQGIGDVATMAAHPFRTAGGMATGILQSAVDIANPDMGEHWGGQGYDQPNYLDPQLGTGLGGIPLPRADVMPGRRFVALPKPDQTPEQKAALDAERKSRRLKGLLDTGVNIGAALIPGGLMAKAAVRGAVGAGLGAYYAPEDEAGDRDRIRGATIGLGLGELLHQAPAATRFIKGKVQGKPVEAPPPVPESPHAGLSHDELIDAIRGKGPIPPTDALAEFERRYPRETEPTPAPETVTPPGSTVLPEKPGWKPRPEPQTDPLDAIPDLTFPNREERRASVEQGLQESPVEQLARKLREARRLREQPTPEVPTPDTKLFAPLPPEPPPPVRQVARFGPINPVERKPFPTLGPPSAKVEPQPIPPDVLEALGKGSEMTIPPAPQVPISEPVPEAPPAPAGIPGAARRLRLERSTPPVEPVQPQTPVPPAAPISGAVGKPAKVLMRDGSALPAQYRVVEAADLQPSHDPFTFLPNERYPKGVQGRDYQRNGGAQEAVKHRTINYSPDIALDPSEMAASGVPTILPDGTVLAGNERVMLAKRVVEQNPQAAADYRQQLVARAEQHGVPAETIAQMQHPVLVRELTAPEDIGGGVKRWQEINRLSDESATKEKSSLEAGSARAQKLANASESLRHLTNTMQPEQTIADYAGTPEGRTFARMLVQDGVITPEEFGRLSEADGTLKPEGRQAVRDMLLSTAITDPTTLADSPSAVKNKLEHAIPSIVALKGTEFDISPVVTDAMKALTRARDLNVTLQDLAAQTSLLGDEVHHSPAALHLADLLDRGKVSEIKAMFREYARTALGAKGGEIGMFGDQTGHETPTDVFNKVFRANVEGLPEAAPEPIRQAAMPEPQPERWTRERIQKANEEAFPLQSAYLKHYDELMAKYGKDAMLNFDPMKAQKGHPIQGEDRAQSRQLQEAINQDNARIDAEQRAKKAQLPPPEKKGIGAAAKRLRGKKAAAVEPEVPAQEAVRYTPDGKIKSSVEIDGEYYPSAHGLLYEARMYQDEIAAWEKSKGHSAETVAKGIAEGVASRDEALAQLRKGAELNIEGYAEALEEFTKKPTRLTEEKGIPAAAKKLRSKKVAAVEPEAPPKVEFRSFRSDKALMYHIEDGPLAGDYNLFPGGRLTREAADFTDKPVKDKAVVERIKAAIREDLKARDIKNYDLEVYGVKPQAAESVAESGVQKASFDYNGTPIEFEWRQGPNGPEARTLDPIGEWRTPATKEMAAIEAAGKDTFRSNAGGGARKPYKEPFSVWHQHPGGEYEYAYGSPSASYWIARKIGGEGMELSAPTKGEILAKIDAKVAAPEGDTFRAGMGAGRPTPIDPTQHGLFSPEETPRVERGGQLGFGLDDELPLAAEDRGPKGLTEATAKAERILADPKEQMMAKAGKPSQEYRDALALISRDQKYTPEEVKVRGTDTFRAGMGSKPTPIKERAPEEPVGSQFDTDVYHEPEPIENLPAAPGMERGSRSAKETLAGAAEAVVRALNPEWMDENAQGTAGTIRSTRAQSQEQHAQAQFALREAARRVGKFDRATQVQLHDALENWSKKGAREFVAKIDPELPAMLDEFKRLTEKYAAELTKREILEQTMADYVGRFFTRKDKTVAQVIGSIFGKRPMAGPMSFAKERSILNFRDAVTPIEKGGRGLTPATYNFVEAQLYKFAEMGKAIATHDALQIEMASGRAQKVFTMLGEKVPEGWRIGDRNDPKLTIYGPNKVGVGEYADAAVDAAIDEVIKSLPGLTHERKLKIGGRRLGYAEGPAGNRMVTKFGTYAGVAMHELGHILDFRYGLFDRLKDPPGYGLFDNTPEAKSLSPSARNAKLSGWRGTINRELRALAEERGLPPEKASYYNNRYEKAANAVHALIYAPELMEKVAPNVKARLTEILQSDPRLAKVLQIKPSLKIDMTGHTEVEIPGRPILGYYAFPEGSAQVWDNALSRGFKGNPLYDMLQLPMQSATQLLLGVSGFHGVVITTEQIFSELALGMQKEGLKGVLKAAPGAFASPVKSYKIGNAIMEEYRNPGSHPEYRPVMEFAKKGGWGVGGESDLGRRQGYGWADGERVAAFKRAFDDALHGSTKQERLSGAARVVPDAIMAGIEIAAHPILGKYVPAQKTYATWRAAAMEVEKLGPNATADQVNKVMADVTKQMDYRFGQVMYHNHFMNNAVKHITQLLIMAPGWTFGTVALAGHGFGDVAQMGKEFKASGYKTPPKIPRSAAYWVSSVVATAFINGVITYLSTGQMPTGKDFLAFRDGSKDADGNDNRHTIPGYLMHDIYGWSHHPIKTFKNKLSPGVHWAAAVASNEDYFGNKVYDPNADYATQLKQLSEYTLNTVVPISVKNWQEGQRRQETGPGSMLMNAAGINPAPREFQRTDAQNTMARLSAGKGGGLAPEEADRAQRLRQAKAAYRAGNRAPFQEMIASGEATRRDLVMEARAVRKHPVRFAEQFSRLSLENAEQVYKDASPEEKPQLLRILLDKRRRERKMRSTVPK